ncbi:hypothetical protein T06_9417 [Trichinella sp. T6]|nr:hypothetical protein T06_9417 [Trichinella sp. T6]
MPSARIFTLAFRSGADTVPVCFAIFPTTAVGRKKGVDRVWLPNDGQHFTATTVAMTAMRGAFDRLLPLVGYDRSTRSLYRRLILVKTVEHFEYMRTQVTDTQKAKREMKIQLSTFQCSKCWEREAEISLSNYKNIERLDQALFNADSWQEASAAEVFNDAIAAGWENNATPVAAASGGRELPSLTNSKRGHELLLFVRSCRRNSAKT